MIRKVVSPLSWEGSVLDVPYTSSYLLVPVKWFRLVYFRSTYLKNFKVTPPLAKERLELAKVLEDLCFFSEKKSVKKTHPSWLPLFVMLVEGGSRDAPQTFTLGPATFTLVLAWGCSHFQGRMACRAFFLIILFNDHSTVLDIYPLTTYSFFLEDDCFFLLRSDEHVSWGSLCFSWIEISWG